MSDTLRYGVFKTGNGWSLISDDGTSVSFPSRDEALAAAAAVEVVHRTFGQAVEISVQDELSQLRREDRVSF